jgi:hypothetical protein
VPEQQRANRPGDWVIPSAVGLLVALAFIALFTYLTRQSFWWGAIMSGIVLFVVFRFHRRLF